jgi:hypothetical protein
MPLLQSANVLSEYVWRLLHVHPNKHPQQWPGRDSVLFQFKARRLMWHRASIKSSWSQAL